MMQNQKRDLKWEPDDFKLEARSIWSFPERGNWATHTGDWRGNWSPYIPRNLILRYSKEGDLILDQFVGGGTTLVEAKLLNRNSIGIDVNDIAIKRCQEKTNFEIPDKSLGEVQIIKGDARKLTNISDRSIDLICTHPPYADIIKYSDDISDDLSLLNVDEFIEEIRKVADECYRVLKPNHYCAVLIADVRKYGKIVPISFELMNVFIDSGFGLKEIVIKKQHNCRNTDKWIEKSLIHNFLLIEHEYLFIFTK